MQIVGIHDLQALNDHVSHIHRPVQRLQPVLGGVVHLSVEVSATKCLVLRSGLDDISNVLYRP
ncbi:hypothetical protein D3C80_2144120 [compost metagenome]